MTCSKIPLLFFIVSLSILPSRLYAATADHLWVHGNCLPGNPQYGVSDVPLLAPDSLVDDWTQIRASCSLSTFLRTDKKLFQLCPYTQDELCFLMDDVVMVTVASEGAYWLVLKTDGTVWGWGSNTDGNLGDGTYNNGRQEPVQALGLSNVKSIAIGAAASYALKEDGTVWAWGSGASGQLGDGNWGCTVFPPVDPADCYLSTVPKQVPDLTDVKALFDGPFIIKNDGTVWGWGPINCIMPPDQCCFATTPQQIEGLEDIVSVGDHVALKADGTVWTWGDNAYGRLGIGTIDPDEDNCYSAVMVPTLSNVTWVGRQFAIKADGTLWGWGSHYGLGIPPNGAYAFPTPVQVKPLRNVKFASIFSQGYIDYAMVLAGDYDPVTITQVLPLSSPFRIKLKGTGFLSGLEVYPNTPPVLYVDGTIVDGLEVKLNKKGMLLFKSVPASTLKSYFPKGVAKTIQIKNPDGRISNEFQFTR